MNHFLWAFIQNPVPADFARSVNQFGMFPDSTHKGSWSCLQTFVVIEAFSNSSASQSILGEQLHSGGYKVCQNRLRPKSPDSRDTY